jgi:predicted AAA+ superfamily ATPase
MLYEFIESSLFEKYLPDYLSDDEYVLLQKHLCEHPNASDLIKGSGGVRKLRWAREGTGKSSGVRACYYVRSKAGRIYMLVIYAKSARDSILGPILKELKEEMENVQADN